MDAGRSLVAAVLVACGLVAACSGSSSAPDGAAGGGGRAGSGGHAGNSANGGSSPSADGAAGADGSVGADASDGPTDAVSDLPAGDGGQVPMACTPVDAGTDAADANGTDARGTDASGVDAGGADAGADGPGDGPPPVCGNGKIETGEQCELPNNVWQPHMIGITGCSATCHWYDFCTQEGRCDSYPCTQGSICDQHADPDRQACITLANCLRHDLGPALVSYPGSPLDPTFSYCNQVDAATCKAGAGYGACRPEFEVAAGTSDPVQVVASWSQSKTVVSDAVYEAGLVASGDPMSGFLTAPCAGYTSKTPRSVPSPCAAGCPTPSVLPPVPTACANPAAPMVWTQVTTPLVYNTSQMWSGGPDDTWLAAGGGLLHWDGTAFVAATPPWGAAQLPTWGRDRNNLWFRVGTAGDLAWWNGSTWMTFPLAVDGVYPIGKTGAWIVSQGTLLEWDGTLMHVRTPPQVPGGRAPGSPLLTVTAADDVWAFFQGKQNSSGFSAQSRLMHWDGGTWSEAALPQQQPLLSAVTDAWASAKNDVWALTLVTNAGYFLWHFDGSTWQVSDNPAGVSRGLTSTAPSDMWAQGPGLAHFDGTKWSTVAASPGWGLTLAAVAADDQVWAFSGVGGFNADYTQSVFLWHRDCDGKGGYQPATTAPIAMGGSFDWVAMRPTASNPLRLWTSGPDDLWLMSDTTIERWNGSAWQVMLTNQGCPAGTTGYRFGAIWGSSSNDVWAASADALRQWNGSAWENRDPPGPTGSRSILGIWGFSPTDVWIAITTTTVDPGATTYHWDGTTWAERPLPPIAIPPATTPSRILLNAIWGAATDDVWAVGMVDPTNTQVALFAHWNGQAWQVAGDLTSSTFRSTQLTAAWGTATNNISAVAYGDLWHYDGLTWTRTSSPASPSLIARVGGSGPNDVWFPGFRGVSHWDGTTFTLLDLGAVRYGDAVSPRPGEVWILGSYYALGPVLFHGLAR